MFDYIKAMPSLDSPPSTRPAPSDDPGIVLDGINNDGCFGWDLVLRGGVLECHLWHCDFDDIIVELMTDAQWDELLKWRGVGCERKWPDGMPRGSTAAGHGWYEYLGELRSGNVTAKPPVWFTPPRS